MQMDKIPTLVYLLFCASYSWNISFDTIPWSLFRRPYQNFPTNSGERALDMLGIKLTYQFKNDYISYCLNAKTIILMKNIY